jgi:hypothetical protein
VPRAGDRISTSFGEGPDWQALELSRNTSLRRVPRSSNAENAGPRASSLFLAPALSPPDHALRFISATPVQNSWQVQATMPGIGDQMLNGPLYRAMSSKDREKCRCLICWSFHYFHFVRKLWRSRPGTVFSAPGSDSPLQELEESLIKPVLPTSRKFSSPAGFAASLTSSYERTASNPNRRHDHESHQALPEC